MFYEAYEYQTLTFGQPAVIRSMVAAKATAGAATRPHGFTHIAAPQDKDAWVTDIVSPGQLLGFDGFISLREFWEIPASMTTYPVSDWQPSADTPRWETPLKPPREMTEALVLRYWKALSARAFSDSPTIQPVEIIVSDTTDAREMIAQAKAFFRRGNRSQTPSGGT